MRFFCLFVFVLYVHLLLFFFLIYPAYEYIRFFSFSVFLVSLSIILLRSTPVASTGFRQWGLRDGWWGRRAGGFVALWLCLLSGNGGHCSAAPHCYASSQPLSPGLAAMGAGILLLSPLPSCSPPQGSPTPPPLLCHLRLGGHHTVSFPCPTSTASWGTPAFRCLSAWDLSDVFACCVGAPLVN